MESAPGSTAFLSPLVYCEINTPVQVEDRYINPALAPHYIKQDFSMMTPSEYLMKVTPLTEVEHIVEAVMSDGRIQRLLSIPAAHSCLVIHRRTWSNHTSACMARLMHPGNRDRLGGRFAPDFMSISDGRTDGR